MKIQRYLFPVVLLATFFLVIALGITSGYWQTQGSGRRGQSLAPASPTSVALAPGAESE
jgi:hypothetical protein